MKPEKCYCEAKKHLWNARRELEAARHAMPDCEKWHGTAIRRMLRCVVTVMSLRDTIACRGGWGYCDCDRDGEV